MNIAIIPARGGSKRIPRKNIRTFCGKPILAYSIEAALKSGCFKEVMVSTDDEEIAAEAERFGAHVPFMRSQKTSSDCSSIVEVLIEVITEYEKQNIYFDILCSIMATAPFLTEKIIQKGYQLLINSKVDSVTPVVQYSFPIQRAVLIKDERLIIRWPENYSLRSQDCEPHYHEAGLFDFGRVDAIKKEKRLPCSHASAIIIPESMAQDVDTEEDWKLAEFKYQYISGDRA